MGGGHDSVIWRVGDDTDRPERERLGGYHTYGSHGGHRSFGTQIVEASLDIRGNVTVLLSIEKKQPRTQSNSNSTNLLPEVLQRANCAPRI